MTLNVYMHPRNLYKCHKPSFRELAAKYPFLNEIVIRDECGKVSLDFKQPKHLAALARALLLNDFQLDVDIPLDRLIPTIPLRLNYILWVEDILQQYGYHQDPPLILDVGVGSSCIYPIIGARKNGWNFIGLESDPRNFTHSVSVVRANGLEDRVHVIRVNDVLAPPIAQAFQDYANAKHITPEQLKIDIIMANPPFFSDVSDAVGVDSTRSLSRCPAKSVSSAARQESQTPGGEVGFASRLAEESLCYKNSIGICTVMLGKKCSVAKVRKILETLGITQVSVYEMCQGRVMRWGVAWTFFPNFQFPVSEFRKKRKFKRPPLTLTLPENVTCLPRYTRTELLNWLQNEFKMLKMRVLVQKNRAVIGGSHLFIEAFEDTWTHARRRRREDLRKQKTALLAEHGPGEPKPMIMTGNGGKNDFHPIDLNSGKDNVLEFRTVAADVLKRCACDGDDTNELETKRARLQKVCEEGQAWIDELDSDSPIELNSDLSDVLSLPTDGPLLPLLVRANVFVESDLHGFDASDHEDDALENPADGVSSLTKNVGQHKNLEANTDGSSPVLKDKLLISIDWLGGQDREHANRILFYLKNKLR